MMMYIGRFFMLAALLLGSVEAGCKTYYFTAEIQVQSPGNDCSALERKYLGKFINRVINKALDNVDLVSIKAKVCSGSHAYDDDDGYDDDGYDDDRRFLGSKEEERPNNPNDSHQSFLDYGFIVEEKDDGIISDNVTENGWSLMEPSDNDHHEIDPIDNHRVLKRYNDFYYVGGGACRLCNKDNADGRRNLAFASSSTSTTGGSAYARATSSGSSKTTSSSGGSGSYESYSSSGNSESSSFSFSSSSSWRKIKPTLEKVLSEYLTNAVWEKYNAKENHCLFRRSVEIYVYLTRKYIKQNANPKC